MAHDIFISYSRHDKTIVMQFYDRLTELGYSIWIDKDGIESGDNFPIIITRAIKKSRCVLFFSSSFSNSSGWVPNEIHLALNKGIPVIPVKLDEADYNEGLELRLSGINFIDYSNPLLREEQMQRFLRSIQNRFPLQELSPKDATPSDESDPTSDQPSESACNSDNGDADFPTDPEKAVSRYTKAAELGDAEAQFNLGVCYDFGEGVQKDPQKAAEWYLKAAEQGHPKAQFKLGVCYEYGEGVRKNPQKSVYWYSKAAEHGDAEAQFILGVRYEEGDGVNKNAREAARWYKEAAEQGHPKAQFNLGWCYESGLGKPKSLDEALSWYKKAAEQGNEDAKKALRRYRIK
jgi:hypothetical protein